MADWNNPATWAQAYHLRGGRPDVVDVPGGLATGAGFGEDLCYIPVVVEVSPGVFKSWGGGRKYFLQLSKDEEPGLAHFRFRLQTIGATGTFTPAAETLIIGCGLGPLIEAILDAPGDAQVWGTDISTVIQGFLDDPEVAVRSDVRPLILNIDVLAADAADQFKAAGAGNNKGQFRNLVTEHMLEDWPLANLGQLLAAIDALRAAGQSNVFHLVTATDAIPDHENPNVMDPEIMVNRLSTTAWAAELAALGFADQYIIDEVTGNVAGGA